MSRLTTREFHFGNAGNITIQVQEILDSAYGFYTWASAYVLAWYIYDKQEEFCNSTILELGAGTGLPSHLLTRLPNPPHLIVTDIPEVLSNIQSSFSNLENVWVRSLHWGNVGDVLEIVRELRKREPKKNLDWIIGADLFYDNREVSWMKITESSMMFTQFPLDHLSMKSLFRFCFIAIHHLDFIPRCSSLSNCLVMGYVVAQSNHFVEALTYLFVLSKQSVFSRGFVWRYSAVCLINSLPELRDSWAV
ncbi:uncharacterized protein VTP21DRAFT_11674 [Calcarisporiella thermophila]|uniref:uncharacterized protein n=1 Tax=Calcarisporiella thermophila TaxID=911321 RepID=UPI0037437AF2